MKKIAFVTDFDGTITDDDFFEYTTRAYFDEEALKPWREYRAGEKTHFNALREIFSKIRVDESDLLDLIYKIRVDGHFDDVLELCQQKEIPIYICSAGNDYYIKHLLSREINEYNISVVTNHGQYSKEKGLEMFALPKDSPFYDEKVGISKYKLVKRLKDLGYFVIFAGDGPPDFEPAKIADIVFARKILLEKCLEAKVKTRDFNSFADVLSFIKEL